MRRRLAALRCRTWRLAWLLPVAVLGCEGVMLPKGDFERAAAPTAIASRTIPTELVGLNKENVQDLLGEPQLIRRDGPAEVWQYTANACILDLFLYEVGEKHRVEYMELRTQPGEAFPKERCYEQLRQAKKKSPA